MQKYSFVKQNSSKDCGAACLAMIIKHYHGFVPLEKLYDMTKTTKNGTSAYDLIKAAEEVGFHSYGIKYDLKSKNDNLIFPAIAHVLIDHIYPHFIVIYHIDWKNNTILIADPASKIKKITLEEFKKIFTGVLIQLYPIRKIQKDTIVTNKYFLNILSNSKKQILIALLFIHCCLIISFFSLYIFTTILKKWNRFYYLLFFLLVSSKFIFSILKNKMMINTNIKITKDLSNQTFQNIISLPYLYYRDHTTGDMMTRMNDIDVASDFVSIFLFMIHFVLIIVISSILLFFIQPTLFFTTTIIILINIIVHLLFHRKLIPMLEQLKTKKEMLNSFMTESILGFESIKGLNLESKFIECFKKKNDEYLKNLKQYQSLKNKMEPFQDYMNEINMMIIIGLGFFMISKNELTLSNLVLYYIIFSYLMDPIKNLMEMNFLLKNVKISFSRILSLFTIQKKSFKKDQKGEILFQNSHLSFSQKKILKNVNITIQPKDKIMIYGPSGSGKSTLLKILKQYYQANQIFVNQINYNELNFKDKIIYISQNEYLFTDTLYNNILLGRKIEQKKLQKILRMCYVDEIIAKNQQGLNMLIEENGFNLSGGEKQRIILARSLISNFEYLCIDEGLSEIDINLERKILKNILKEYPNQAILFVSHRLDNLDLFDKAIKFGTKVEMSQKNKGGVLCFNE